MTCYAAARAAKGWSVADAAARLGTDELTYARMERAPTPVLHRLAKETR